MGILRPSASSEVWSNQLLSYGKLPAIKELVHRGDIIPVDVEGMKAHATRYFLSLLDHPPIEPRVIFIAPLDQFMWDRKMIAQLFDFDYTWEVYVPEAKRKWGYYVLPVLFGDKLVARAEFWCREGVLEIRQWHFDSDEPGQKFFEELEVALRKFMTYCSATKVSCVKGIDHRIKRVAKVVSTDCKKY